MALRGSIEAETNAQPFRSIRSGAIVANCDIAMELISDRGSCACNSTYATVYNVYVHGTGDHIFYTNDTNNVKFYKVYSTCQDDNGNVLTDKYKYVTAVDSAADAVNLLSDRTTADDTAGMNTLKSILGDQFNESCLSVFSENEGSVALSHPEGFAPEGGGNDNDNDNGDADTEQHKNNYKLSPFMWGLVQRSYNGVDDSILLLKVSDTTSQNIGAPLFEEELVYTLTIDGNSQKVTPFEKVGRLAIGFNLADVPELGDISDQATYQVSLKVEKEDGTVLLEGSTDNVSAGMTKYIPVSNIIKDGVTDNPDSETTIIPDTETTIIPKIETTVTPDGESTDTPDGETTVAPDADTTEALTGDSTNAPEEGTASADATAGETTAAETSGCKASLGAAAATAALIAAAGAVVLKKKED